MEIVKIINPENVSDQEADKFEVRTAVRAVVFDQNENIALLHVSKLNYYKLPGGGVETGEDLHTALKRECLEELGCNIEITGGLGQIIEYRKLFNQKQISPCYLARAVGNNQPPSFTSEEKENGFEIMWVSLDDAIKLLSSSKSSNSEATLYIVPRDKYFLELARNLN